MILREETARSRARPARPAPSERLDPRARTLWRWVGLIFAASLVLLAALIGVMLVLLDVGALIACLPAVVTLLVASPAAIVVPDLLWRHWRYEIGAEEVDLQHGVITITRTLIPMARIQHVDTRRGPLERRFGLASVVLYTAAGAIEIPALAADVAASVRDRIATLANTRDEL
jgi:membrane protein YdbS with pleckstrin-like domain